MRTIVLCGISALLAGCVTNQPEVKQVWVRTDGKQMSSSVALQQQFDTDKLICDGEVQKNQRGQHRPYLPRRPRLLVESAGKAAQPKNDSHWMHGQSRLCDGR